MVAELEKRKYLILYYIVLSDVCYPYSICFIISCLFFLPFFRIRFLNKVVLKC